MANLSNQKHSLLNDYLTGVLMVLISALFVWFIFFSFETRHVYSEVIHKNYAYAIGGILSVAFQIIFLISGGWERPIYTVIDRWSEFIQDIGISFKYAIGSLLKHYFQNGIVLLLYIFILLSTINMSVHGVLFLIELYGM